MTFKFSRRHLIAFDFDEFLIISLVKTVLVSVHELENRNLDTIGDEDVSIFCENHFISRMHPSAYLSAYLNQEEKEKLGRTRRRTFLWFCERVRLQ